MEKFANNPYAIAVRAIFEECPQLHEHFDMEEYLSTKVELATERIVTSVQQGIPYNPDLREDVLETTVLFELKQKKAEIENYA